MTGLDDLEPQIRNVLVLAPPHDGHWADACRFFHTRNGLGRTRVLVVTYALGASNHLSRLDATTEDSPESVAVVEATGNATTALDRDHDAPVAIRHEAPADLTGIGIQCAEFLTRWHDARRVSVCFESLTSMLQYTTIETAYRFLHVVTTRVTHTGATGHYHLSPDAHSRQEIGTLKQLFDAVATYDDQSETWDVVQR